MSTTVTVKLTVAHLDSVRAFFADEVKRLNDAYVSASKAGDTAALNIVNKKMYDLEQLSKVFS